MTNTNNCRLALRFVFWLFSVLPTVNQMQLPFKIVIALQFRVFAAEEPKIS